LGWEHQTCYSLGLREESIEDHLIIAVPCAPPFPHIAVIIKIATLQNCCRRVDVPKPENDMRAAEEGFARPSSRDGNYELTGDRPSDGTENGALDLADELIRRYNFRKGLDGNVDQARMREVANDGDP
jgi:hypothetical protein